jgi:hypothetical protein
MLHKEKAFVLMMQQGILIMGNGWMICLTEKVNNNGVMELDIKAILQTVQKMAKVF